MQSVLVMEHHVAMCESQAAGHTEYTNHMFLCKACLEYTTTACMGLVIVCYRFMAALPTHPSPSTSWTNPFRRVRELEEELRLMDQNLKSMMCGEEEVLTVQSPPRSHSDLLPSAPLTCSLSTPLSFLSSLHLPSMTSSMSFKQFLKDRSVDSLCYFSC